MADKVKYARTWEELVTLTPEELAEEGFVDYKRTRNEKGNSVVTKEFRKWIDKERAKPKDPNAPKIGATQAPSSADQIKRIKEIYGKKLKKLGLDWDFKEYPAAGVVSHGKTRNIYSQINSKKPCKQC